MFTPLNSDLDPNPDPYGHFWDPGSGSAWKLMRIRNTAFFMSEWDQRSTKIHGYLIFKKYAIYFFSSQDTVGLGFIIAQVLLYTVQYVCTLYTCVGRGLVRKKEIRKKNNKRLKERAGVGDWWSALFTPKIFIWKVTLLYCVFRLLVVYVLNGCPSAG